MIEIQDFQAPSDARLADSFGDFAKPMHWAGQGLHQQGTTGEAPHDGWYSIDIILMSGSLSTFPPSRGRWRRAAVGNWRVGHLGETGQIHRRKKFQQDKTITEELFFERKSTGYRFIIEPIREPNYRILESKSKCS